QVMPAPGPQAPTKGGNGKNGQNGHRHHRIHERRSGMIKPLPAKSEINVTPLVDVVLVLLIIFMVVTPLLHRGVHLDLPETKHHPKKQDTGEQVVVSVRKDGTYIEADRIEPSALVSRLQLEMKNGTKPINVRADRALRYGEVRKVLEQVHQAGAQ